jgi:hypothetical protein
MKKLFLLSLLFVGISMVNIVSQTIKIEQLPSSVEEFVQLRDEIAKIPEGGAAIFMVALKIYTENEELGKQCLVAAVDKGSLCQGTVYKGFELLHGDMSLIKSQINNDKNIPNSYIKGTSPKDSYKTKAPFIYEFSSNAYSGDLKNGNFKIFVKCMGADSPRPINLIKNDKGIWKASSWSSVLVGIKKPPITDDL